MQPSQVLQAGARGKLKGASYGSTQKNLVSTTEVPMPIYVYRCQQCNEYTEALQKASDELLKTCPLCQADALVKVIAPVGVIFKGTGFHKNDYSGKSSGSSSPKSDGAESKPAESKSDSAASAPSSDTGGASSSSSGGGDTGPKPSGGDKVA